jgi:hypothetical protein
MPALSLLAHLNNGEGFEGDQAWLLHDFPTALCGRGLSRACLVLSVSDEGGVSGTNRWHNCSRGRIAPPSVR